MICRFAEATPPECLGTICFPPDCVKAVSQRLRVVSYAKEPKWRDNELLGTTKKIDLQPLISGYSATSDDE